MARNHLKLSDVAIRKARLPDGKLLLKLSDGDGMYLLLRGAGKFFRLDYRYLGYRKTLALGRYPATSLADARAAAFQARKLLATGVDPSSVKRKQALAVAEAQLNTLEAVMLATIAEGERRGLAETTHQKRHWLMSKVRPQLLKRPINEIRPADLMRDLDRLIQEELPEAARKLRALFGQSFRYAIQRELCEMDPSAALRGSLSLPKSKHHPAILERIRFGELLAAIHQYRQHHIVTGTALELMALLYPRPGELRKARWGEIDWEKNVWRIPAERMKMRAEHVIPLSRQALELLRALHEVTGYSGTLLPAIGKPGRFLSENTMNQAIRRIGFPKEEHCSHGFRATASTMLYESNKWSGQAIEISLAHADANESRKAYSRSDRLAERFKMGIWWANTLDEMRKGKVDAAVTK